MVDLLVAIIVLLSVVMLLRYDIVFKRVATKLDDTEQKMDGAVSILGNLLVRMDEQLEKAEEEEEEPEYVAEEESVEDYFGIPEHLKEKHILFDERIANMERELRTGSPADELHPLVFNYDHDEVKSKKDEELEIAR